MQIFIVTLSGKSITLNVSGSDTFDTLKNAIEAQEGIPRARQRLILAGKKFEDIRTLDDYGVREGSTINLVLHNDIDINVRKQNGTVLRLADVDPRDVVNVLVTRLVDKEDVSPGQVLVLGGRVLLPDDVLGECGVIAGSVLELRDA